MAPTDNCSRSIASSDNVAATEPSTTTSKRPLRRGFATMAVTNIGDELSQANHLRRRGARATRARLHISFSRAQASDGDLFLRRRGARATRARAPYKLLASASERGRSL